jgi:hypothetical protein
MESEYREGTAQASGGRIFLAQRKVNRVYLEGLGSVIVSSTASNFRAAELLSKFLQLQDVK